MDSQKVVVQIDPESPAFQQWLALSGGRTFAEFQEEVIGRITDLCDENERVIRCLVFHPSKAVHVIFGVEPPYDFELGAQISAVDIAIAQQNWHYTSLLEFPGGGNLDELRNFGRFCAESTD